MKRIPEEAIILTEAEYEELIKAAEAGKAAKGKRKAKPKKRNPIKVLHSITAFLFVTSQVAALLWVSTSYVIAGYATFVLGQPFPIETLSEQAIIVLLGVLASKVVENIFEHNDGVVWGNSKKESKTNEKAEG